MGVEHVTSAALVQHSNQLSYEATTERAPVTFSGSINTSFAVILIAY